MKLNKEQELRSSEFKPLTCLHIRCSGCVSREYSSVYIDFFTFAMRAYISILSVVYAEYDNTK